LQLKEVGGTIQVKPDMLANAGHLRERLVRHR